MSKKHTLFALCCQLEIRGKEEFKAWLVREGYGEEQIDAIRADMKALKEGKAVDYAKVY